MNKGCPLRDGALCSYFEELPANGISTANVFYIFDSTLENKALDLRAYLKDTLPQYGLKLVTFDSHEGWSQDIFCGIICRGIRESPFVIADVSCYSNDDRYTANPNVMLELGLALGLGKPYFLVRTTDEVSRLPFDIRGLRVFNFNSHLERRLLEKAIVELSSRITILPLFDLIEGDGCDLEKFYLRMEEKFIEITYVQNYLLTLFRPPEMIEALSSLYRATGRQDEYIELFNRRKNHFYESDERKRKINHLVELDNLDSCVLDPTTISSLAIQSDMIRITISKVIEAVEKEKIRLCLYPGRLPFNFNLFGKATVVLESLVEGVGEADRQVFACLHSSNAAVLRFLKESDRLFKASITDPVEVISVLKTWLNHYSK